MKQKSNTQIESYKERPVWSNSVRYIALVCLILVFLVIFYLIRGSITLIVLAALVAYLLNPIVRFLNNKLHIQHSWSIAIAYILLLIVISLAVSIIIPWVTQAIRNFFALDWPQILAAIEEYIAYLADEIETDAISIGGFTVDLSKPLENLQNSIHSLRSESINLESLIPDLSATARQIFSFSTNIFGQILTTLIMAVTTIMASVYFCRDGHKFRGYIVGLFEEKYQPEVNELLVRMKSVWNSYFAGEIKLMIYIGAITFLVYFVLGLRWALLLGIIAGFCEVVPNIGPILAAIPAIVSSLIFGSRWLPLNNVIVAFLAVIAAVIIQQTENIFLVPHIMGNALELHPVVIIIGILALSSRMGLLGTIFAAPIIALAKEILYFIINKIKRQDPYPNLFENTSENT